MSLREQWRKIERERIAQGLPAPLSSYKEESADLSVDEIAEIGVLGASKELLRSISERRRFTRRGSLIKIAPADVCPRTYSILRDAYINKLRKLLRHPPRKGWSSGVDLEQTLLWFVAQSHERISTTANTVRERARIEKRRTSAELWCLILSLLIEAPRTSERTVALLANGAVGDDITEAMVGKLCERAYRWLRRSPKFSRATRQELADIVFLMRQRWLRLGDTAANLVEQAAPPTRTSEAVDAAGRPVLPQSRPETRLIAAIEAGSNEGEYGRSDYGHDEVPAKRTTPPATDEEQED